MGRLQIRQLSGKRRTLDLRGRSGCLSPVALGIQMRGETKWAPLADEGVPFSLGGMPQPIEFEFRWNDALMFGSNAPIVDGSELADSQLLLDAIYDICADGETVELQHEHRVMFGIIRDVSGSMTKRGYMTAQLTFEPQRVRPKRQARPGPEPERALAQVQRIWARAMQTASMPATMTASGVDALASGVGAVNSALRALNGAVENYRNTRRSISALGQAFAHASLRTERATKTLDDAYDASPGSLIGTDDASLWLDFADMHGKLGQAGRRMRQRLLQEREVQRLGSDDQIQTVHYAAAGTNLRTLAVLYWGAKYADQWRHIAEFNQLEGAYLAKGQSVVIPYPRSAA
jgi:hypothetical protein